MGNLVNKIQLPVKCSKCGNKIFRAQYTAPFDRHIHSLDYCAECDKEREYKLMKEMDLERSVNLRNKNLASVALILAIAALVLIILSQLGLLNI